MSTNTGYYQPTHDVSDTISPDGSNATVVTYDKGATFRILVGGKEIGRGWGPEGLNYVLSHYPKVKVVNANHIPFEPPRAQTETLTVTVDSKAAYEALQEITNCSDVTRALLEQLIDRDAHGKAKYGVTLDRTDLNLGDWLQHQAEELMDGAGYALAAKREYERLRRIEEAAREYQKEGSLFNARRLFEALEQ